ncbi:MAG TPA: glycosyltransferase family 4 protein [Tepidisphaeraceae bacterium]|nr:glycosyltransferase family 4 protein [Tepidisphaeraceae bacterium]
MRILHLTAGSDAGGVSRYLYDLCAAMQAAGHQVAIAGEKGAWHEMFRNAPWPWIDAPLKGGPLRLAAATRILRRYLAENPVDVLHTHYRKATIVARRLQKHAHAPIVYTLHLSHIPLGGPWRLLSDFGDQVHAAASDARDWLVNDAHVPPQRITLIPHGIHPERFPVPDAAAKHNARASLGLADDDRVALYLGRLEDPKNESWLIDLAATTQNALPRLRVLIAGDGPNENAVRKQIEHQNLNHRIQMLGHREPLPLLHAADALLLPSQREGFSYACAEAMCAGVPVLRTRTSGTKDLIVENTTGRSVEIDREAFLKAAGEFLADKPALQRMGIAAAEHIRRHFAFDRQLSETIAMYDRLTARK